MEAIILLFKEQFRHFVELFSRDSALYLGVYGIIRS
jgi:hypothetical protein